jgi:hypothetical protein
VPLNKPKINQITFFKQSIRSTKNKVLFALKIELAVPSETSTVHLCLYRNFRLQDGDSKDLRNMDSVAYFATTQALQYNMCIATNSPLGGGIVTFAGTRLKNSGNVDWIYVA